MTKHVPLLKQKEYILIMREREYEIANETC